MNPIQEGEGVQKGPPTSFSFVTSTNVRISPQNFLTFSFITFDTGVKFQGYTYCQSQIIGLEPRPPHKKSFFQSNPYKNPYDFD